MGTWETRLETSNWRRELPNPCGSPGRPPRSSPEKRTSCRLVREGPGLAAGQRGSRGGRAQVRAGHGSGQGSRLHSGRGRGMDKDHTIKFKILKNTLYLASVLTWHTGVSHECPQFGYLSSNLMLMREGHFRLQQLTLQRKDDIIGFL